MYINPSLLVLIKPPALVIWNYQSHEQYSIDKHHSSRLIELIEAPARFDPTHPIDSTLLATGILSETPFAANDWGWDDLSRIFHIGTKDLLPGARLQNVEEWARHYLSECQEVMGRPAPEPHRYASALPQDMIYLPTPCVDKTTDFKNVLLERKTCRDFFKQSVSLHTLSHLLYLSLGYLKEREGDCHASIPRAFKARRSSPSGGGLNSTEGYLYAYNIKGLGPGFYYYHPDKHALTLIKRISAPLATFVQGQHFINNLPLGLFITSRFDKMWWKYPHSQGYRVSLLEAGHISQTLQLTATALGMKTWVTAALSEEKIEQALGLNNLCEQPLLFVGAGYSNGEALCAELKHLLAAESH
jgi:SagB-type dehydrogenase family enzyme